MKQTSQLIEYLQVARHKLEWICLAINADQSVAIKADQSARLCLHIVLL